MVAPEIPVPSGDSVVPNASSVAGKSPDTPTLPTEKPIGALQIAGSALRFEDPHVASQVYESGMGPYIANPDEDKKQKK